jgi:hypothetical protein
MPSQGALRAAERILSTIHQTYRYPDAEERVAKIIDREMGTAPEPEHRCPRCNHRVTGGAEDHRPTDLCSSCRALLGMPAWTEQDEAELQHEIAIREKVEPKNAGRAA